MRVHHPRSRAAHGIPHFARIDTAAQQPRRGPPTACLGSPTARRCGAALRKHGGVPRRRPCRGLRTARRCSAALHGYGRARHCSAALHGYGGAPRRRPPRQQLGGVAHPLVHQPHQVVHHALLASGRAISVVQEEDHVRDANTLTATIRIHNNRILTPTDPTASIVIPTRARPDYLRVALASIAPQAAAAGAELLVVEDDGPRPTVAALAERFGAATSPMRGRSA